MHDIGGTLWAVATIGGPIVLGLAILYAVMKRRRVRTGPELPITRGTERGPDRP